MFSMLMFAFEIVSLASSGASRGNISFHERRTRRVLESSYEAKPARAKRPDSRSEAVSKAIESMRFWHDVVMGSYIRAIAAHTSGHVTP